MRTIKIRINDPKVEYIIMMLQELNLVKIIEEWTKKVSAKPIQRKWSSLGKLDFKGKLDTINIRNFANE